MPHSPRPDQRGSVLIVVLIVSAIMAVSLASYLNLSNQSLRMADRSFINFATMNLADMALEEAIYDFNKIKDLGAAALAEWTIAGNDATRTFSGFTLGENSTGLIKVFLKDYNAVGAVQPVVVIKSVVTPAHGPKIVKWVEATLRRRGFFSLGLVARESIVMQTNTYVDSYRSDQDDNPSTPGVMYSASLREDNGFVGVASSADGALDISNGNVAIYGRVSSGGGSVEIGSNTSIYDSSAGALYHPPSPRIYDPSLVTTDFSATFPPVTMPTPGVTNDVTPDYFVDVSRTLPGTDDVAASDGRYYYTFGPGQNIRLTNNCTLTINARVTFILNNHSSVEAIELTGNGCIDLGTKGSVEIYTNGDLVFGSNAVVNGTRTADNFSIFGTKTAGTQTFAFNSTTLCNLSVYAPNSDVHMGSNSHLAGSVVANRITADGDVTFHYDESLNKVHSGNPFRIGKWKELTTAKERAAWATSLNF